MIHRDTLFTNVALTADNEPWWEGRKLNTPVLDWQGKPFDPASGGVSAHPNSRFTVSARNNPIYSPRSEDAAGVPISAIVFGTAGAKSQRWSTKRAAGSTASSSAHRSHPKPRPPPPALWASCGAIRWR
jgi:GTP-dependent phosphoenolpyruvate carboxykinase